MNGDTSVLVLGIGNVLMGDEGVGVHVVRELGHRNLPPGVECMDGGTGGFHLLGPMQEAERIILIDATADGAPIGTVRRVCPRFSSDYPRTLTAHDIGLKDLLDVFHLFEDSPEIVLFAVSIALPDGVRVGLSDALAVRTEEIADLVYGEVEAAVASFVN